MYARLNKVVGCTKAVANGCNGQRLTREQEKAMGNGHIKLDSFFEPSMMSSHPQEILANGMEKTPLCPSPAGLRHILV